MYAVPAVGDERKNSMKALVVYDSQYGNTERVAQVIVDTLGGPDQASAMRVGQVDLKHLEGLSLLIVGSPTQRFNPTPATTQFLKGLSAGSLKGIKVAAFDTRFTVEAIERIRILAFFVRIFGYAAEPIAKQLKAKGGTLVVPPEGFYVKDTEGPLLEEELERAGEWARQIVNSGKITSTHSA
jgi:flavodoxin I